MDVMALAAAVDIVIDVVVIGIVQSNIKDNDSIPTYDLLILLSNQYLIETTTIYPQRRVQVWLLFR